MSADAYLSFMPLRTAAEQFALAGTECGAYSVTEDDLVLVAGKGGRCCMKQDQWEAYYELCAAPTISMRAVDAEDEIQWDSQTLRQGETTPAPEDLQRIYGALETALGEVVEIIEGERGVTLCPVTNKALTQAQDRLRLCIGTVSNLKKGGAA